MNIRSSILFLLWLALVIWMGIKFQAEVAGMMVVASFLACLCQVTFDIELADEYEKSKHDRERPLHS